MKATLLVGFLSVISASIVDKKTLIALCIISGPSSNSPIGWFQTLFLKNPKSSNFGKILWPYFSVSKTDPKNEILIFFAHAIFEKLQN